MKNELNLFFTALMFYTRIPCPKGWGYPPDRLSEATKYFPLIGWIVGGLSALVFVFTSQLFPQSVAIVLSMIVGILATGAFHEDGFADVCDGFGGGWSKAEILAIMKDSRSGAFGVVGIALMLLLKFATLAAMNIAVVPYALVAGHALSRLGATTLIFTLPYVREDEQTKAKPIAKSFTALHLSIAAVFGLAPTLLLLKPATLWSFPAVAAMTWYLSNYFKKWIGGYTGDCLGATQQVVEVTFYLSLLGVDPLLS